jgi:hypothetical protein
MNIFDINEISKEEFDSYYIMKQVEKETPNWNNLPYGKQDIILSDKMKEAGYILEGNIWIKIN